MTKVHHRSPRAAKRRLGAAKPRALPPALPYTLAPPGFLSVMGTEYEKQQQHQQSHVTVLAATDRQRADP